MKEVSQMLKMEFPLSDDGEVFIITGESSINLDKPRMASQIICPWCEGSNGYYSTKNKQWCCLECKSCKYPDGFHHENKNNLKDIGVAEEFVNADFQRSQSFTFKNESSDSALGYLKEWAKKPLEFVVLAGPSGRGKTYAACCVLSMVVKYGSHEAYFINASDLYVRWKDSFSSSIPELQLLTFLSDKKLLVLDDLGIRPPTDGFLEFIYILLNKRKGCGKGTLMTTNLTSQQLTEKLGSALSSRICSGRIIVFDGPDKRRKLGF